MIEHYLTNNNENATVLILQKFLHLNKPLVLHYTLPLPNYVSFGFRVTSLTWFVEKCVSHLYP